LFIEKQQMTDTQQPDDASGQSSDQAAGRAALTGDEPAGARAGRHLHRARLYTRAFAFVGLIAVLIVLISANTRTVKVSWAFGSTRASLVWIILATAVIGWLLGIATAFTFRRRTRRRS
jgi:uncharacterized integral membrane protein